MQDGGDQCFVYWQEFDIAGGIAIL